MPGQCQAVYFEQPRFCCVMSAVVLLQDFYTASPQFSQVVPTGVFQARLLRISPLGFDGSRAAMQLELYGLLNGLSEIVTILEFRMLIHVADVVCSSQVFPNALAKYVIVATCIEVTFIVHILPVAFT